VLYFESYVVIDPRLRSRRALERYYRAPPGFEGFHARARGDQGSSAIGRGALGQLREEMNQTSLRKLKRERLRWS
jgi:hypothetical protein